MALKHFDGFAHTTDPVVDGKYGPGSLAYTGTSGRFDAGGFNAIPASGGSERRLVKVFSAGHATWIVGVAFRTTTSEDSNDDFIKIMEGATIHMTLRYNTSGLFSVLRGGTTLLATGTKPINANTWYYVEFKVTIHDSTGSAEVRVDGVTDINVSGADTRNAGTGVADRVMLTGHTGSSGSPPTYRFDDYYICDGSGGSPTNDFLGDIRVETLLADGNGNSSQFDGSDGNTVDNYLLVDEATNPDDDTTYVESADAGDKDTYTYGDLSPTVGTVYGVQILPFAKKTNAGSRNIATVARLSGTEVDGPSTPLSTTYAYLADIRETKPGGGAWSITDVNNAEFGQKVSL